MLRNLYHRYFIKLLQYFSHILFFLLLNHFLYTVTNFESKYKKFLEKIVSITNNKNIHLRRRISITNMRTFKGGRKGRGLQAKLRLPSQRITKLYLHKTPHSLQKICCKQIHKSLTQLRLIKQFCNKKNGPKYPAKQHKLLSMQCNTSENPI